MVPSVSTNSFCACMDLWFVWVSFHIEWNSYNNFLTIHIQYIITSTVILQITWQLHLWKLVHLNEDASCREDFPAKNNVKGTGCVFGHNFTLLFYSVTDFHVHYVSACIQRCIQIFMFICMYQYAIFRK
jgi:hypothetical protein